MTSCTWNSCNNVINSGGLRTYICKHLSNIFLVHSNVFFFNREFYINKTTKNPEAGPEKMPLSPWLVTLLHICCTNTAIGDIGGNSARVPISPRQAPMSPHQSAEYVKYAKIFGDYFWLIFIPTEDLGNQFLLILCLLKILATNSCSFYAYWRSWRPILPILCLLKILASQWQPILAVFVLVSFQFPQIIVLVMFQKSSCKELGTDETGLIWNGMIIWNAIRKWITFF